MARSCELPFDKLRACTEPAEVANGWFIAPFVVSLSNHASAFRLLVQIPLIESIATYFITLASGVAHGLDGATPWRRGCSPN